MERVDLQKEIQEVYLHSFLFKLAINLVAVFLPLYILSQGYSIAQVMVFFTVYYLAYIVFSVPNAEVSSKLGYKHTSLLASPLVLLFYLLLRYSDSLGIPLVWIAAVGGYGFNLYWMGMNPEVAASSHAEERSKETGYFFSMPTLAAAISPFLGGLIVAAMDFDVLFTLASALVGMSFLPFLLSSEHREGMETDYRDIFNMAHLADFGTYTVKGVASIGKKVLWPLYLAVIIQQATTIGGAGSLLAIGGAAASILSGKYTRPSNRKYMIGFGTLIAAASYILMAFVTNTFTALAVSALNGLSYTVASVPIYSKALDHAEKEDHLEYFAMREIALAIGRIATLTILTFLITPIGLNSFTAGFIFIAVSLSSLAYFGNKL